MSYRISPDSFGSMFAVPTKVVDNFIKLSSSSQLKTLLWICRHSAEPIDSKKISAEIGYSNADINDALLVLCEWGVLIKDGEESPIIPEPEKTSTFPEKKLAEITAPKPSNEQVAKRCKESPELVHMFSDIEKIIGKTLGYDSQSVLIMMLDHYGLPVEVIYTLVSYCVSVGKSGFSYIAKVGKDWGEREIDTLEKADEQVRILNNCNGLWRDFAKMAGIQNPRPSSSQSAYLRTWSVDFKYNVEMIYLAYEEMLNHSSRISFPYMNKILSNWYSKGLKTPDDVEKEKAEFRSKQNSKKDNKSESSFDIDKFIDKGLELPVYKKGDNNGLQ